MFNQYRYISAEHHVALESCVRNHNVTTAKPLAELYRAALDNVEKPTTEPGKYTSHFKNEALAVGTATDIVTGLYVQLALVTGSNKTLITIGRKIAAEQANPVLGGSSTILW